MNEFREDPSIKKYLSIAKDKEFGLTLISAGTGRGKTTACVNSERRRGEQLFDPTTYRISIQSPPADIAVDGIQLYGVYM